MQTTLLKFHPVLLAMVLFAVATDSERRSNMDYKKDSEKTLFLFKRKTTFT